MKYAQAVAYFRQLCCMGLRGETVVPALLQSIHAIVPSDFNSFFWAGEAYNLSNMYSENPRMYQFAPVYFEKYYNNDEVTVIGVGFSDAMRRGHLFGNSEKFGKKFTTTDMYNDLWNVVHIRHVLEVTVCERGRGWGVLKLARGTTTRPFSDADEKRLKIIAPYIAHAIKAPVTEFESTVGSDESGIIVVDRKNQIAHSSDVGRYLFYLATKLNLAASKSTDLVLPQWMVQICENLRKVITGKETHPPKHFHSSPWGNFIVRGYSLNCSLGKDDGLITLLIERQIPIKLKIMLSPYASALSAKERDVCLLLYQNLSHLEIAKHMHIKPTTVIYYVRNIYNKLDVHNHRELFEKFGFGKEEVYSASQNIELNSMVSPHRILQQ